MQMARLPPTIPNAKPLYDKLLLNVSVSLVGSKKKCITLGAATEGNPNESHADHFTESIERGV